MPSPSIQFGDQIPVHIINHNENVYEDAHIYYQQTGGGPYYQIRVKSRNGAAERYCGRFQLGDIADVVIQIMNGRPSVLIFDSKEQDFLLKVFPFLDHETQSLIVKKLKGMTAQD